MAQPLPQHNLFMPCHFSFYFTHLHVLISLSVTDISFPSENSQIWSVTLFIHIFTTLRVTSHFTDFLPFPASSYPFIYTLTSEAPLKVLSPLHTFIVLLLFSSSLRCLLYNLLSCGGIYSCNSKSHCTSKDSSLSRRDCTMHLILC